MILVTGGAGFIGGHLAEKFVRDGHAVVVLDNLDPFYDLDIKRHNIECAREAAQNGPGSYEFIEGDIRDDDLVTELVDDATFVFHQAAQAGVRTSVKNPRTVTDINVEGTLNVLDAARNSTVERVVFASSSSVYGKPSYLPYDEDHPTTPVSPYGVSKLAAENYVRVYGDLYDIPTVALRYFTVYGPRMRPNMAISNFVSRCMNTESPVIYGDGTQTRDFTYIDDIVRTNSKLLDTDAADGEVLNIGSTDNVSIATLAEVIRDTIAPELAIEHDERRTGDAEHTHADVTKASNILCYEPTENIRSGVQRFIAWYRENREWYEPLVQSS
ncbi:SDR family oxidoreductase [Halococcus thailandensis]|uniref:NAD-dependent epimerase/dehydratase n=1 Tax=Halococcus thailandensis JCM 13552 TaxID=1227457 RepID=M0MR89_9EURY|nr:SDR family oxidoreductase [Halococcus thailandensis]EMA48242.1 NAD-dependent epimerase/dehydratase [Halococcus thailandensis JCM 13552]